MRREKLGSVLLFFLAAYSFACISWYSGSIDGGNILLTGIVVSSAGGALLFYRWRTRSSL